MSTNRGNGQHRARNKVQSLGAAVKLYPSPMPSDVRGGRTTKGKKRPNEGGLRKAVFPTPRVEDGQSCGAHNGRPDTLTSFTKLFPTPTTWDAKNTFGEAQFDRNTPPLSAVVQMMPTPGKSSATQGMNQPDGKRGQTLLGAARGQMWPTPKASAAGPDFAKLNRSATGMSLQTAAAIESHGGTLNPDWVEWLMGWPIGWTALKPLETGRFQEWLDSHGGF